MLCVVAVADVGFTHSCCEYNKNNIHLSCTHQCPERSHDTCEPKNDILHICREYAGLLCICVALLVEQGARLERHCCEIATTLYR